MDTNENMLNLIKAQSELLLYLAEHFAMMQCAFEAFVRQEVQDFGPYTEFRAQLFQEEFSGKLNVLLQTLRMHLDHANTASS